MVSLLSRRGGLGARPEVPPPDPAPPPEGRGSPLDDLDRRLRRAIVWAFVLGSVAHLLVTHARPGRARGFAPVSDAMVLLGFLSALAIARLPWDRYGRDLFAGVLLYSSFLIAGLIYSTGGPESPFASTFLLIAISAGLYHGGGLALLVAVASTLLGYLPFLYAAPGRDFLVQQLVLSVGTGSIFWFQRLVLPEVVRRARAEEGLQADLRETRRLRDELARANAQLAEQARTDALTGLPNHGAIVARADEELARAARAGTSLSLLFFDLDHFKAINDTHGHAAGDRVLAGVGPRAAAALRPGDALGRYGGEEFLALLPGAGPAEAARIAERLRAAVRDRPFILPDGTALAITISVGVASCPTGDCVRQILLREADAALYAAKRAGRDRVCRAPEVAPGEPAPADAAAD